MKTPLYLALSLIFFFAGTPPAVSQVAGSPVAVSQGTANGGVTVSSGEHHKTSSGLEVWTDNGSKGHATVHSSGNEDSVTTSKNWSGDIDGVQAGDSVALGNRVDTWVTGTGGDISFSTGTLLVTNLAEAGGDNITVTDGKGVLHTVAPGETRAY